jgi:hypothetical protein
LGAASPEGVGNKRRILQEVEGFCAVESGRLFERKLLTTLAARSGFPVLRLKLTGYFLFAK